MKKTFEILETVAADKVPPPRSSSTDYAPLFKAVATLAPGESLKVWVDKPTRGELIRGQIKARFKANPLRVTCRTNPEGGFDVYIIREPRT